MPQDQELATKLEVLAHTGSLPPSAWMLDGRQSTGLAPKLTTITWARAAATDPKTKNKTSRRRNFTTHSLPLRAAQEPPRTAIHEAVRIRTAPGYFGR
jgi:hypothetical protein